MRPKSVMSRPHRLVDQHGHVRSLRSGIMRRFASLFGRRGVLAAAGVAGGVLAMVVVQELLGSIASTALASVNQVLPPLYFDTLWSGSIVFVVLVQLPMAVGVFF